MERVKKVGIGKYYKTPLFFLAFLFVFIQGPMFYIQMLNTQENARKFELRNLAVDNFAVLEGRISQFSTYLLITSEASFLVCLMTRSFAIYIYICIYIRIYGTC